MLIYLRNIFQIRIRLPICWTTKPFHNFSSKCTNTIFLFIVISYLQIKEMIYTREQTQTLYRESTYKDFIQTLYRESTYKDFIQTLYRESTYKDFIQTNEMYFPYVVGRSSIVLLPIHNFSNLLSVIFIEHNFIIYMHKHRIV
jgi:hypothetical protein